VGVVLAGLLGVLVGGLGTASASALAVGGRDAVASGVGSAGLACDDGHVHVAFEYRSPPRGFWTSAATLSGIADACAGRPVTLTGLAVDGSTVLVGTGVVGPAGATAVRVTFDDVPATVVRSASVSID
jgi:hypothetical protein